MMAMIALWAIVWPNVGPTDWWDSWTTPKSLLSLSVTFGTSRGTSLATEIWNSLGLASRPVRFLPPPGS